MEAGTATTAVPVRVLALPESSPAVVYGLYEVLHSVGTAWTQLTGEPPEGPPIDARIVARTSDTFVTTAGVPVSPQAVLEPLDTPQVVIVGDVNLSAGDGPAGRWPLETRWLRDQYERGALVCSVCTGSLLLAEAALLDGLDATTHWSAIDLFARHYPSVRLRPAAVLLPAGTEHRIVTSGGAASWEDLVLYVIARFCGPSEARRVAKVFLLGDRSEGQLPFAAPIPRRHGDAVILACQEWIREHITSPAPVAGMVERSRLTERTFKRRFSAVVGCTPLAYVHRLRIEAAKHRLETSADATDAVAAAVGYEDPAFFRRLFKRHTGVTPARYRTRFQRVGTGH
jgi:transcriptional regulator GlxA family with amidase domain